jgi:hypothetical protein
VHVHTCLSIESTATGSSIPWFVTPARSRAGQVANLVQAFSNGEPVAPWLDNAVLPLTIGMELGGFIQGRLYPRSDYLFRKAVLAYNRDPYRKHGWEFPDDPCIERVGRGTYEQHGLTMSTGVLYHVLREQPTSRAGSIWAAILHETSTRTARRKDRERAATVATSRRVVYVACSLVCL